MNIVDVKLPQDRVSLYTSNDSTGMVKKDRYSYRNETRETEKFTLQELKQYAALYLLRIRKETKITNK
jgi:hypothetical protein